MKKGLWIFLGIVVVIVLVLGWFGFIPGLSNLLGANKPKDLGVKYSEADLNAARKLTGVDLQSLDAGNKKSINFSGQKNISGKYSSEMITAMISSAKYKYYPLSNTQVKISNDGTVETSGNFNISKAAKWSSDLGGDASIMDAAKSYMGKVSTNPSFYLKGRMSVMNNQISLNISEAKISRFTAPQSIIDQYQDQLATFVEQRIVNVPGMQIRSANFSGGKLNLDATYPAVEKSIK
jgi:hypothetical protein